MFILELNSDIAILENNVVKYDYTEYLSFELKATTNNFFNEGFAWTNELNGTTRIIPGMPDLDRTLFLPSFIHAVTISYEFLSTTHITHD